ncbi:MAG: hypothetical protein KME26_10450 [Oscillatoria princeps RMCB-10]|nr:hypothetical protein [Oscillatoria princeps RMCB-10]
MFGKCVELRQQDGKKSAKGVLTNPRLEVPLTGSGVRLTNLWPKTLLTNSRPEVWLTGSTKGAVAQSPARGTAHRLPAHCSPVPGLCVCWTGTHRLQ